MGLAENKYQHLFSQKGVVMDIWGAALKKQHTGKKLLHKMMIANEHLGVAKGF